MTGNSDGSGDASDGSDANAADRVHDAGYDDWVDALAEDAGYYLACPEGHGSVPPRRVCPDCGSTGLVEEPLPDVGAVETFTAVHVPPPRFADEAPYVTAIADFGPVRLTGVLRGVDPNDGIPIGLEVTPGVERRATDDGRIVTLRPV